MKKIKSIEELILIIKRQNDTKQEFGEWITPKNSIAPTFRQVQTFNSAGVLVGLHYEIKQSGEIIHDDIKQAG